MKKMRYRLRPANPHDSFATGESWTERVDGHEIGLDGDVVSVSYIHEGAALDGSEAGLDSALRAWQASAYLADQFEIWFEPLDGQAQIAELFAGREHVFTRPGASFPRPDPEFALTAQAAAIVDQLRAQMTGAADPLATAAAVLELIEQADPSPEVAYNIDGEVLATLRGLVARREAAAEDTYRAFRGPEWQWLQEAVRLIGLQVGRATAGRVPAAALTASSFRPSF